MSSLAGPVIKGAVAHLPQMNPCRHSAALSRAARPLMWMRWQQSSQAPSEPPGAGQQWFIVWMKLAGSVCSVLRLDCAAALTGIHCLILVCICIYYFIFPIRSTFHLSYLFFPFSFPSSAPSCVYPSASREIPISLTQTLKKKKEKKKGGQTHTPGQISHLFLTRKAHQDVLFFHFLPSSGPSFSNTLSSRWLSSVTCSESVGECPLKSYLSANFSHRNIFINASLVFMQRLIQKDNAIKRYRFTEGAGVSFISIRFKDLKVWKDRVWKSTQNNC